MKSRGSSGRLGPRTYHTMLPRYAADYRTLLWTFVLTPAAVALAYARPDWALWLCPINCYFGLACGVIAHNHNHCPTFSKKLINQIFANWISIFYGYPTFAWIPTHNLNHHKFVNRVGDATITWRHTNEHVVLVAITYPFVSSYWQQYPTKAFISKARASNPKLFRTIVVQWVCFVGAHLGLLSLAIALHGLGRGVLSWTLACFVPAVFALWTIMVFNYEMHVHTDPWSAHNHSRSWDGKIVNFLLFNNGLHGAHHENPGTHWSELWSAHDKIAPLIDPRLVERNVVWYFFRMYVLGTLSTRFRSTQVGRAPFDGPSDEANLASADVELGEAGTNAPMLQT